MENNIHHYLTRVWHLNTAQEAKRLKDLMSRNGFSVTLDEARDLIIKFFEYPHTQELINTGNFPVTTQPYTGNIRQDTMIDPRYVIAIPRDFEVIHGNDTRYEFTLVVTNKDFYENLDTCKLKLNYGLYDIDNKRILNAVIGVDGIN
jgi:hypothetical protein